eukprot:3901217-Pleurochrysis_carterae.AAC.1
MSGVESERRAGAASHGGRQQGWEGLLDSRGGKGAGSEDSGREHIQRREHLSLGKCPLQVVSRAAWSLCSVVHQLSKEW